MAAAKKSKTPSAETLRALSEEELRTKLQEERKNLFTLRMQHATAQLEKVSELKATRRSVARMETILTEKAQRA
ncbi:MAG: 50S ribosomal protein L29 [Desulfovibrio sp.]|nr:50S ribosomal protein L29 [Desulfovibrio sp.]